MTTRILPQKKSERVRELFDHDSSTTNTPPRRASRTNYKAKHPAAPVRDGRNAIINRHLRTSVNLCAMTASVSLAVYVTPSCGYARETAAIGVRCSRSNMPCRYKRYDDQANHFKSSSKISNSSSDRRYEQQK